MSAGGWADAVDAGPRRLAGGSAPGGVEMHSGGAGRPDLDGRVGRRVLEQIRAGRPPDPRVLGQVLADERAALGEVGVERLRVGLAAAVLGAGGLEGLLAEPGVTDVAVNGDGSVWADRGDGMRRVELDLGPPGARRALAVRLAGLAGRRLDDATAYVDAVLPSGVRLHAILPPLVPEGPHLTLRVPARQRLDLADLVALGAVPAGWVGVLSQLMRRRRSFVVTGGTGAGKTTVLAALLALSGPRERIVVVEDVRELAVEHPHVVRLEGRPPNVEGAGEVTMVALVRQALRMRPDRLVVGEVRGAEVRELLAALNTGHEGGCGTLHANAIPDVLARFEALGSLAGLSVEAVRAQVVSAVQVVVQLRRTPEGVRAVDSLGVVLPGRPGPPVIVPVLLREGGGMAPERWGEARERLEELVGAEVVAEAVAG